MIFYEDYSLNSLLAVLTHVISIINIHEVMNYPKLANAVYSFMKELISLQPFVVSYLPSNVFQCYMDFVVSGLHSDSSFLGWRLIRR